MKRGVCPSTSCSCAPILPHAACASDGGDALVTPAMVRREPRELSRPATGSSPPHLGVKWLGSEEDEITQLKKEGEWGPGSGTTPLWGAPNVVPLCEEERGRECVAKSQQPCPPHRDFAGPKTAHRSPG